MNTLSGGGGGGGKDFCKKQILKNLEKMKIIKKKQKFLI
jgi:hypothetical protein